MLQHSPISRDAVPEKPSSQILEKTPSKVPPSKKRTPQQVVFRKELDVVFISSLRGDHRLWYQRQDYRDIAAEIDETVSVEKAGRRKRKEHCLRGLEEYIHANPQISRERRMKAALIVLLEYDRQLDEEGRENLSEERLAHCLKGVTRRSADRARNRGLSDEVVARGIYKRSKFRHVSSSDPQAVTKHFTRGDVGCDDSSAVVDHLHDTSSNAEEASARTSRTVPRPTRRSDDEPSPLSDLSPETSPTSVVSKLKIMFPTRIRPAFH